MASHIVEQQFHDRIVTAAAGIVNPDQQERGVVDQSRQVLGRDDRLVRIEALYEREFTSFVRVARGVLGDRERALEAVHDGFAAAIRARAALRDDAALEAWVWKAVINAARKAARRPLVETSSVVAEPTVDSAHLLELTPTIARLPERQRLVVFLRYYADLDYRRIAQVLDVEVGTVSAALATAHRTVRRLLEEVDVSGRG